MWRLKPDQPAFEIVDGPMAGKRYVHGVDYQAVLTADGHRFYKITASETAQPEDAEEDADA